MSIEFNKVRFSHTQSPDSPVLDIDHWSVERGSKTFVQGPSGAGKSTLLNLISGLLYCQHGQISVLGQRLDQMSTRARDRFRAAHIGYVFQRLNLVPYLNAIENVQLASSFVSQQSSATSREAAKTLLASLDLSASHWRKATAELSVGQQQRVAIARALINHPEVLIADEPTSSLDTRNRDKFIALLMPIVTEHNITLLCVSHDPSLAVHFDKVQSIADINGVG